MANSTSDNLKLTVQATGENSGTWGQITNTNLLILEQAIGGYQAVALNATTGATLTFSNGALSDGKNQVLKLTGTITTNVNVTIPDSVEKTYVIENGTTGAFTVTVKTTSGSGVTWGTTDKGTKMVYSNGTDVVDTAFTDLSSDITPQLSANLDTNGNNIEFDDATGITDDSQQEQLTFSKTASAVNNIQIKNAATSSAPEISAIGDDSNIDLTITPKGDGNVVLDGLKYPNADGSADQLLKTDGSGNLSFVDAAGGTSWQSSVKTTTFTAVAGEGYWVNTTGGAFTVTLPGSAAVGDTIEFSDYLRTWGTNAVTFNTNSLNFQGNTSDSNSAYPSYNTNGQSVRLVYSGATQGWIPTSDDDVSIETPQFITTEYLVVAGGGGGAGVWEKGGGGGGAGGYRNSYSTEQSGGGGSTETPAGLIQGETYTITVGAGGAVSADGEDSSIEGTNISITSFGGATGSPYGDGVGGSGGGGSGAGGFGALGSKGTANQGFDGARFQTNVQNIAGGGGGASEVGQSQNGGNGLSSSITGSAVTRGGGGGGQRDDANTSGGSGGGGGGARADTSQNAQAGTANTGGGGGGGNYYGTSQPGTGGSGVVILRIPTADYSGKTTGSPTVGADGTDTVITYNSSGTYTA
jgi:hypothetical protein